MQQIHFDSFVCDYCNKCFIRKYNLQTHIENFHNATCYCDICDQRFGSPAGLLLHLSRGHNRNREPFPECDLCGRIFTRKQNITSHMITVHLQGVGSEVSCKFCFKSFTTEKNLKRHQNQFHNTKVNSYNCVTCDKVFKDQKSLIIHYQRMHEFDKDLIKCDLCYKVYSNIQSLKRHVDMLHRNREDYKCILCPKVYTSNQSLQRHIKSLHSLCKQRQSISICPSEDQKNNSKVSTPKTRSQEKFWSWADFNCKTIDYMCNICNMGFDEEPTLRKHMKSKHSFQAFYEYCRISLLKRCTLNPASVRLSQQIVIKCKLCINTFTNINDLKYHMKMFHDVEYCLSACNVCFKKFYCKETLLEHKKTCLQNANSCNHCDKLFTVVSSLEFHTRIFHPQAQTADTKVTSTNSDENPTEIGTYKCKICSRAYYSDRSLKHHIKLKHTNEELAECEKCGKICNNKYYLAAHLKMVHNDETLSKCDYCDKMFRSKRNIRRHIEYTHLGMKRYKCIECQTLFKEKRSLRKHVRTKHPHSTAFPQCHICHKRFESAKSCKIHLKLLHSFILSTHPCGLCSVSFSNYMDLRIHLQTEHLAKDDIYKCEECNMVINGLEKFEKHVEEYHENLKLDFKQKMLPRCIICMKDFSTRKTLKRHIQKFHDDFDTNELLIYGSRKRVFDVDCENCIRCLNDEFHYNLYLKLKQFQGSVVFKCEICSTSFNPLEYAIQRSKLTTSDLSKSKMILSELCTAEMSDEEASDMQFGMHPKSEIMEPESTTDIKMEPFDTFVA